MGKVDLVDQRTAVYDLERKSSIPKSSIPVLTTSLSQYDVPTSAYSPRFQNHQFYLLSQSFPPENKTALEKKYWYQYELSNLPTHHPEYHYDCKRCAHSNKEGFDRKTYIRCTDCGVFQYLVKERNCFLKHQL